MPSNRKRSDLSSNRAGDPSTGFGLVRTTPLSSLSSNAPQSTARISRPLVTPDNLQAPAPSSAVSGAFAALSGVFNDAASIQKFKYDREQQTYLERASQLATQKTDEFFRTLNNKISSEVENGYRYRDGEAIARSTVELALNNENFFSTLEGYDALSDKNKERLRNAVLHKATITAGAMDQKWRVAGEDRSAEANIQEHRRQATNTAPQILVDDKGGKQFDPEFSQTIGKAIVAIQSRHAMDPAVAQREIDSFANDIIDSANFSTDEQALAYREAFKKAFSSGKNGSVLTSDSLARLDSKVSAVVNRSQEEKVKDALVGWRNRKGSVRDAKTIEEVSSSAAHYSAVFQAGMELQKQGILEDSDKQALREVRAKGEALKIVERGLTLDNLGSTVNRLNQVKKEAQATLDDIPADSLDFDTLVQRSTMQQAIEYADNFIENLSPASMMAKDFAPENIGSTDLVSILKKLATIKRKTGNLIGAKFPKYLLPTLTDQLYEMRTNPELYSKYDAEDFKDIVVNSLAPNDDTAKLNILTGLDIDLSNSAMSINMSGVDYGLITADIFSRALAPTMENATRKLLGLAHLNLSDDTEYKALLAAKDKGDTDKEWRRLQMLKQNVAAQLGRRYLEHNNRDLYLNAAQYPLSVDSKDMSNYLEVARQLSASLAFGPNALSSLNDILEDIRFSTFVEGPVLSSEAVVEALEGINWEGSNLEMKNAIIAAARKGTNASTAISQIKSEISSIRSNSRLDTDSDGNVRFSFRASDNSPMRSTKPISFSGIQNFIGADGTRVVDNMGRGFLSKYLPVFFPKTIFEDIFVFDEVDGLFIDLPLPETAQDISNVGAATTRYLEGVNWGTAADIGLDGDILKITSGPFTAVRVTKRIAEVVGPSMERQPEIEQSGSVGLDAAHIATRSFATLFEGLYPTALDGDENLDRASIELNRYIQESVEAPIRNKLRDFVNNNDTSGMTGEWILGTYSTEVPTINKGFFNTFFGTRIKKERAFQHLQANLTIRDSQGEVVAQIPWEVTDKKTLDLISRTDMFSD